MPTNDFELTVPDMYYHPPTKLWEGNVFRPLCRSVCPHMDRSYLFTFTPPKPSACSPPDLFKLFHLGPLYLFKLVYCVTHTSIGRRLVGLWLKDLLGFLFYFNVVDIVNFKKWLFVPILQTRGSQTSLLPLVRPLSQVTSTPKALPGVRMYLDPWVRLRHGKSGARNLSLEDTSLSISTTGTISPSANWLSTGILSVSIILPLIQYKIL